MYQILYFSRTGNSKRIADKIAHLMNVEAISIEDGIQWQGSLGYLKYAFYRLANKKVHIRMQPAIVAGENNFYIVVTPLWDEKPALAIQSLLCSLPKNRVHLVTSSKSSFVKNRQGFLSITEIRQKDHQEDALIETLIYKILQG